MIVALFPHQDALCRAIGRLDQDGIGPVETYTPAPIEGRDESSPIPVVILLAALLGGAASLGLQTYSYVRAYPFLIGGRPQFAWPSFVPTVFENAVLVAVVAGFAAFMLINRMPRLYDPVDEAEAMRQATRDGWVLAVRSEDAEVLGRARRALAELSPERVEEVAS